MNTAPPPGAASASTLRVLLRAVVYCRLGGLLPVAVAVLVAHDHYDHLVAVLALVLVVAGQSTAIMVACLRGRPFTHRWLAADLTFIVTAICIGAYLTRPADGHTWLHFMYPFSLVVSVEIGICLRRVTDVAVVTTVLALAYGTSAVLVHHDPVWNVVPNSLSYYGNTLVAWAITRTMLRTSGELDTSRRAELAHATALVAERQRNRYSRLLHDHVLQTLETLSRGDITLDPAIQRQLQVEAVWLRTFIRTGEPPRPGDLYSDLNALVLAKARAGLTVELHASALTVPHSPPALPPATREALIAATNEALTNVVKHAEVDHAVVQVSMHSREMTVTVVDQGRGFDPAQRCAGMGLAHSIYARITEVGGHVQVDSALGSGTFVSLTVPR